MIKTQCVWFIVGILSLTCALGLADTQVIELSAGENVWGGCVTDGRAMPFGQADFTRDLYGTTQGNQAQPLLLSDRGRYVWCEEPFKFSFEGKMLKIDSHKGQIQTGKQGETLREVFQYVSRTYFYNNPGKPLDQELIVRSTQCSTLMPMMQFSVAPWRVLSKENMAICRDMAILHETMGPEILALARASSKSGEPMVRAMEYMYPKQGYAEIKDQFLLAPVLEKGKRTRQVVFPAGTWQGNDGVSVIGRACVPLMQRCHACPGIGCHKRCSFDVLESTFIWYNRSKPFA